jgi:malate dehydrogenase
VQIFRDADWIILLGGKRIGDVSAVQAISDPNWGHDVFEPALAAQFRDVVQRTGESPAGTSARAILSTIRAITTPTPFEHWFAACVASDGTYYEVPKGLVFGFPLSTANGKTWTIRSGHYLDAHARERIAQNVAELELESVSVARLMGEPR